MKSFAPNAGKSRIIAGSLIFFSTLIALIGCEIILRQTFLQNYYLRPPHFSTVFKPNHQIMPGIIGPSEFVTNSKGIRGDELTPAHTYRILAIGGSTTECLYLDQAETWTQLLQDSLNKSAFNGKLWIGNAGVSGHNTRHHLTAMQYLPLEKMRIDAILVMAGVNDFSVRLSRGENYDPDFLARPDADAALLHDTFRGSLYADPDMPLFKRTAIWHVMRKLKHIAGQEKVQDKTGEIYLTWRKHRSEAKTILNELPDLSAALEEYARNINRMIDLARQKSIQLIFMTQPSMWRADLTEELESLLWFGGTGDFQRQSGNAYYSPGALARGMEKYNEVLLEICRKRKVACIDLASILPKNASVFYDDVHFNENGARKVADILAKCFLGKLLNATDSGS